MASSNPFMLLEQTISKPMDELVGETGQKEVNPHQPLEVTQEGLHKKQKRDPNDSNLDFLTPLMNIVTLEKPKVTTLVEEVLKAINL